MAARQEILEIRMSKQELADITALAQVEKLPTSTLVQRLMLLEAENHGIVSEEVAGSGSASLP